MAMTPQERRTRNAERMRRARAADREALGLGPPPPPLTPAQRRERHAERMRRYRLGVRTADERSRATRQEAFAVLSAARQRALALTASADTTTAGHALLRRLTAIERAVAQWDGLGPLPW